MRLYREIRSLFFLVLFIIFRNTLHAQLSPYHGIVFPYDSPNKVIHSIGSLTYAHPDHSLNVQNNPVGLSFVDHPQVFMSYGLSIENHEGNGFNYFTYFADIEKIERDRVIRSSSPVTYSASIPLTLFNRKFVMALSMNQIDSPEYECFIENEKYMDINFNHQREGHVWNGSFGMSSRLPLDIHLGISWTKWFGNWRWKDENETGRISGVSDYRYKGNVWNFSVLKQMKNISICFVFHTPFTLMRADNVTLTWRNYIENFSLKQKFNGAYKIGVDYRFNNRFSLSVGYRHQGNIAMHMVRFYDRGSSKKIKEVYGSSDQISVAGEYIMHILEMKIPLSIAYWVNWAPKTPGHVPPLETNDDFMNYYLENTFYLPLKDYHRYQSLGIDENSSLRHHIAIGLHIPIRSLNFYVMSQLNLDTMNVLNDSTLPGSSYDWPMERFVVKRKTFMFNLGLSYVFGSEK